MRRETRRDGMSVRLRPLIVKEKKWYVAHCVELGVVSQGKTIEEARKNLKEAVELYVETFSDAPGHTPAPASETDKNRKTAQDQARP